jgi:putative pyruvate formate lyase activating enzyme
MTVILMDMPSYIALYESGELQNRTDAAYSRLEHCSVCPRKCGVNRLAGERGYCRSGLLPKISSYGPHFGEESPLVGRHGSGTIFFSGCNMRCIFCQNYEISQQDIGREVTCEELASIMLTLQDRKCHNINLVSPTHFVPQILEAVLISAGRGLHIPLVYNTGTYDSVETLRLLDGVVDIYMPDAKYGRNEVAVALSDAPGYIPVMNAAMKEMHRQVGDLVVNNGIASRGMIIRHLVLPDNLAHSEIVMKFIAEEISRDAYVNVMDQYRWNRSVPEHEFIKKYPGYESLLRGITREEYQYAIECARNHRLYRLY